MSWTEVSIGELADIKHGFAFKGQDFTDSGEYIVITPGNCHPRGGFRCKGEKEKRYQGEIPEGYLLKKGDLLVVLTDLVNSAPVLGGSFLIPEDNKYLHNQRLGLVEIKDPDKTSKRFINYLFNTHEYRGQVRGSASGATVRHTSPGRVAACKVRVPSDLRTQEQIANTLSVYDDLIENNNRRIELLEAAARQLYKEWFVRFLFPGHEQTKIVNGLPQGWEIKIISQVAETSGGGTPSTKVPQYWEDGNITWFVPKDLTQNKSLVLLDSEKKITDVGLQKSSAKMLPPEAILMSSRASIGYFGLFDGECCTNQGFISVIPKQPETGMYLLHNLMSRKEEIIALAGGTTYKEISKTTFRRLKITMPANSLLAEFEKYAYDTVQQVRVLKKQIYALEKARDILLPKIMSGEIKV